MKTATEDPEVERAANFLARMPSGNTTLTAKQVKALLLKYDGRLMSWGRLVQSSRRRLVTAYCCHGSTNPP